MRSWTQFLSRGASRFFRGNRPSTRDGRPRAARSSPKPRSVQLRLEALEGRVVPTMIILGASKDNTLYQSVAGDISNGAGPSFFAGETGSWSCFARLWLKNGNQLAPWTLRRRGGGSG